MKILVVGLGVIGTTYGYIFSKAGHEVEHLVRPTSKMAGVKSVKVNLLDGRDDSDVKDITDTYSIRLSSHLAYDFIFVSVPGGAITGVLASLKSAGITGPVILSCGIWENRSWLERALQGWRYILTYPVAGGAMTGNTLNCCLFDHLMVEKQGKSHIGSRQYRQLLSLLRSSRLKAEMPYDMLEWIYLHMGINAGVISVAAAHCDINDLQHAAKNLMASSKYLSQVVISIRETAKIIASRGVNLKNYRNELWPYKIPSFLAGIAMKKMFAKNILTQKIMSLHHNVPDLLFVCKSVYDCGKASNVKASHFYRNYEDSIAILSTMKSKI